MLLVLLRQLILINGTCWNDSGLVWWWSWIRIHHSPSTVLKENINPFLGFFFTTTCLTQEGQMAAFLAKQNWNSTKDSSCICKTLQQTWLSEHLIKFENCLYNARHKLWMRVLNYSPWFTVQHHTIWEESSHFCKMSCIVLANGLYIYTPWLALVYMFN